MCWEKNRSSKLYFVVWDYNIIRTLCKNELDTNEND